MCSFYWEIYDFVEMKIIETLKWSALCHKKNKSHPECSKFT